MQYTANLGVTRYRLLICLFLFAGGLVGGANVIPAAAQLSDSDERSTSVRTEKTVPAAPVERKSPGLAVLCSGLGTAALTPVGGVGLLFGPAFGHFYAGNSQQAWTGIYIRAGGFGLVGVGSLFALGGKKSGWGAMTIGALTVGGSALFDVVTAWHSAKSYNEAHGLRAQVTPAVGPRGKQAGLALRVTF